MAKQRACLKCRAIFEGERCPQCNETVFSENFKGEVEIFNPEKSQIARNMKLTKTGRFAIKSK